MNGYFYILLVTSVCGGICSLMAWGGFEKYIKYIASLICVLAMLMPFRSISLSEIDADKYIPQSEDSQPNLLNKTAEDITEKNANKYISEIVFNKFGINPASVIIKIDWDREDPVIQNITVILNSADMQRAENIKSYLVSALGGEVNLIEGK